MAKSIFSRANVFDQIYGNKDIELSPTYRREFERNMGPVYDLIENLESVVLIEKPNGRALNNVENSINAIPKQTADRLKNFFAQAAQLKLLADNPIKNGTKNEHIFSENDASSERLKAQTNRLNAKIDDFDIEDLIKKFEENIQKDIVRKNEVISDTNQILSQIKKIANIAKNESVVKEKNQEKFGKMFEFLESNPELGGLLAIGAASAAVTAAPILAVGAGLAIGGKIITKLSGLASRKTPISIMDEGGDAGNASTGPLGIGRINPPKRSTSTPGVVDLLTGRTKGQLDNLATDANDKLMEPGALSASAALSEEKTLNASARDITQSSQEAETGIPLENTTDVTRKPQRQQKAERIRGTSKLETLQTQSNEKLSGITTILESIDTFTEKTFHLQQKMAESLAISAEAAQLKRETKRPENIQTIQPSKKDEKDEDESGDSGTGIEDIANLVSGDKDEKPTSKKKPRNKKGRGKPSRRGRRGRTANRVSSRVSKGRAARVPKGGAARALRSVARSGTASKLLSVGKGVGLGAVTGLVDFGMRKASGEDTKTAAIGAGGTAIGGAAGAALGTLMFPGIGTAIGGMIGSAIGDSVGEWASKQTTATEKSTNQIVGPQANTSNEITKALTEPSPANQLPVQQEGQKSVLDRQLEELVSIREFMVDNMADFLEAIEVNTSDTTGGLIGLGRSLFSKRESSQPKPTEPTVQQVAAPATPTSDDIIRPASQTSTGTSAVAAGWTQKTASMTKSAEAVAGGSTHVGIQALSNRLAEDIPEIKQFTAFNDAFHQRRLQASKHKQGLAMDLTVDDPSKSSEVTAKIQKIIKEAGINAFVQDEYKKQSAGATGGHIHIQLNNQGDANKLAMALIAPQSQLPSIQAQNTGDAQQVARQSMAQSVSQNPTTQSPSQQNIIVAGGGSGAVAVPVGTGANRPPIGPPTDQSPIVQRLMWGNA